jgi:type I restriction enzyme, S subunit
MSLPERPLGDVLRLSLTEVPVQADETYPIAGVYGFGRGLFQRGPITGNETSYGKLNRLESGKLVMSRLKAFEGALTVIGPEFDGWFLSPEFPTFEIDAGQADQRYIANLCAWPSFWSLLGGQSKGVGARRERVSASRLMTVKVPLPDLAEQRRIAARIHTSFNKISKAEALRDYNTSLRRAIFDSAMEEAVAHQVESVCVGDVCTPTRVPIEIIPEEKYQALGMRSFGKGIIRYEKTEGSELSKLRYYRFPAGALVLSNIKAWEGAIGLTTTEDTVCVASNRFLFYLPCDDRINISYLRHYLLSRTGLAQVAAASPGSADRNRTLSIKRFESIRVPLPDRKTQDRTAKYIDTIDEIFRNRANKARLNEMRTTVLNSAFTGEL